MISRCLCAARTNARSCLNSVLSGLTAYWPVVVTSGARDNRPRLFTLLASGQRIRVSPEVPWQAGNFAKQSRSLSNFGGSQISYTPLPERGRVLMTMPVLLPIRRSMLRTTGDRGPMIVAAARSALVQPVGAFCCCRRRCRRSGRVGIAAIAAGDTAVTCKLSRAIWLH